MDKPATEGQFTPNEPQQRQEAIRAADTSAAPAISATVPGARTYAWWLVLGLVGLDYFSTLAYLPSIAVTDAGYDFAVLAALLVVALTLLAALPIYLYIAGRSPHGLGATGLLENHVRGWAGKLLILSLLSFVATDFVVTRTLSAADASTHLLHNSYWEAHSDWMTRAKESLRGSLPPAIQGETANNAIDWWNEQVIVTVILSVLAFGWYFFLVRGFTRGFVYTAGIIVSLFVLLNGTVIVSSLIYVAQHPEYITHWKLFHDIRGDNDPISLVAAVTYDACRFAPPSAFGLLALGLSGFELSMASIGLVRGRPGDDPMRPRGRIGNARKLLVAAALLMSLFVFGSVLSVRLLVPTKAMREGEPARNRALAYLAHGDPLKQPGHDPNVQSERPDDDNPNADQREETTESNTPPVHTTAADINPLFGPVFGTLYDVSTILILFLAGASVTIGLRDLLPHYLSRYGMELYWVQRRGLLLHLFNAIILLAIFYFHASVTHQLGAYAASVYVLLASATLAAILDIHARWKRALLLPLLTAPLLMLFLFFVMMAGLVVWYNPAGALIAVLFIVLVLGTASLSHWMRNRRLRYYGFTFADEESAVRWEQIRRLELQILVPHRPSAQTLAEKEAEIRARHRGAEASVLFLEVELGDASGFERYPLLRIVEEDGRTVIQVSRCTSIAHVLVYIALEFREIGLPPEIDFSFWGQDKIPAQVHALIGKAAPDLERQPRVAMK